MKAKWGEAHFTNFILNAIWLIKENWLCIPKPKTSLSTVWEDFFKSSQTVDTKHLNLQHFHGIYDVRQATSDHSELASITPL